MATWLEFPYECSPREIEVVRYFKVLFLWNAIIEVDRNGSRFARSYCRFRLPEVFRIAIFRIAASRYCWNSIKGLSEDNGSVEENVF